MNFKEKIPFEKFEIEQIKLADYLEEKKIFKIDFLKIDTEGYEMKVLLGLEKYLKNVSLILFEHHYDNMIIKNYTFSDINDLLKKINLSQFISIKCLLEKHSSIFIRKLINE